MILLDTVFLIWCIRGHEKALSQLDTLDDISLSAVVLGSFSLPIYP